MGRNSENIIRLTVEINEHLTSYSVQLYKPSLHVLGSSNKSQSLFDVAMR